ncbi:MAG: hypothetical protein K5637_02785 [Lachnospiraceae bacterium]|nr:hypothetical protein [Lachnospiraceae bacterium]
MILIKHNAKIMKFLLSFLVSISILSAAFLSACSSQNSSSSETETSEQQELVISKDNLLFIGVMTSDGDFLHDAVREDELIPLLESAVPAGVTEQELNDKISAEKADAGEGSYVLFCGYNKPDLPSHKGYIDSYKVLVIDEKVYVIQESDGAVYTADQGIIDIIEESLEGTSGHRVDQN